MKVGTAGWTLPTQWQEHFPASASHLERYAALFDCVEINSTFYKAHRRATFARWSASVPGHFRFSVKVPRAITHDQSLVATDVLLAVFLDEVSALGNRLGPLLIQLPPSLVFNRATADEFFGVLRSMHPGLVVCEPRHASWFETDADALLGSYRVARAVADPAPVPAAMTPGGWRAMHYTRLHGSPRMYYSSYSASFLDAIAAEEDASSEQWCIFDNTASGVAIGDALALRARLASGRGVREDHSSIRVGQADRVVRAE